MIFSHCYRPCVPDSHRVLHGEIDRTFCRCLCSGPHSDFDVNGVPMHDVQSLLQGATIQCKHFASGIGMGKLPSLCGIRLGTDGQAHPLGPDVHWKD